MSLELIAQQQQQLIERVDEIRQSNREVAKTLLKVSNELTRLSTVNIEQERRVSKIEKRQEGLEKKQMYVLLLLVGGAAAGIISLLEKMPGFLQAMIRFLV